MTGAAVPELTGGAAFLYTTKAQRSQRNRFNRITDLLRVLRVFVVAGPCGHKSGSEGEGQGE